MPVKTKARRTRVTRKNIAKAREDILAQPKPAKQTIEKVDTQSKRKKDSWLSTLYPDNYGDDIYFDSFGLAWGTDTNLESKCVGKTEDVLAIIRGEKPIPNNACPHTKEILEKLKKDREDYNAELNAPKFRRPSIKRKRLSRYSRSRT